MSVDLPRPGSDPLRPHQDLRIPSRIPSQYFNQVLPSSSSTPPVAVQIASLHRASEVARFEWRAAQRARQASRPSVPIAPHSTAQYHTSPPAAYSPRNNTASTSLESAQARDARSSSRVFASVSEAYHSAVRDLNRHTGVGLLDVSDGEGDGFAGEEEVEHTSETSGDSTNTDSEVTAYPVAATRRMRSLEVGDRRGYASPSSNLLPSEDNVVAESQVWDRMVNDLAIGAGISGVSHDTGYLVSSESGPFANQRGVPGGIAASMLALSAAIPRPESQWTSSGSHGGTATASPRLLPHPIWARRYPGAAGEWLRGELARRASASTTQPVSSQSSTSIPRPAAHAPRWRSTSTAQWDDTTATPAPAQSSSGTDNSIYDLFSDRNRSSGARRTSNWDWNVLRFPSLDPASRERRSRVDQAPIADVQGTDETTSFALPTTSSTNTLTVPAHTRASMATPPPPPAVETPPDTSQTRNREESGSRSVNSEILPVGTGAAEQVSSSAVNADAAGLVARMARASRQTAAARAASQQAAGAPTPSTNTSARRQDSSSTTRATRATQGGMSYIRRLRELDGLTDSPTSAVPPPDEIVEAGSPLRAYEVFPWYQPPIVELESQSRTNAVEDDSDDDDKDDINHDPDGNHLHWYQMARDRMAARNSHSVHETNDDPDGERIDEEGEPARHTLGVRRRVITGTSGGASQRTRNRSALVMADGAPDSSSPVHRDERNDSWNAVDGWTLVDQRPMSPVRRSRDEGSENVTTWLREPANPVGLFSTSPQQMNASSSPSSQRPVTTSRTIHSYRPVPASDDPRTTRRPRRMASLIDSEIAPYTDSRLAREDTPSPELLPSEVVSSSTNTNNSSGGSILGRARQLTSIGRRLEEEFRARQGELRQREDRLRSEVARRRVELDQVRRQQGRIGRVIDRTRHQARDGVDTPIPPVEVNEVNEEVLPLLGEQESSLIRRSALREPRRATLDSPVDIPEPTTQTYRGAPPTPLQEILARISLNSSRMHSGTERSLRRTSSWAATASETLHEVLQVTSLDDHHTLR